MAKSFILFEDGDTPKAADFNQLAKSAFENAEIAVAAAKAAQGFAEAIAGGGGVVVPPAAPSAPTGITATGATQNGMTIGWSPAMGAAGYNVYRGGTKRNSTPISGFSFVDTGLTPSTQYSWTVRSVSSGGAESGNSTAATATTAAETVAVPVLAGPASVTASDATSGSMLINWTAVAGSAGYNVYRGGVKVNGSAVAGLSFADAGLTPVTQYSWTVKTINSASVEGAASNAVTASTTSSAVVAPGAPSLWYDPTDISAQYQDSTGLTAVTAAGQSIGRMVDKASGIHWLQANTAARPVLGVRKVNLLKSTGDLGAAPWALNNMTHSNGTLTCTDVTASFHREFATVVPGTQYTFSFKAKKGTAADVKYSVYDASNAADIVAPTSYNSLINGSTDTLITLTFTAPANCINVAVYTSRNMTSLGTVIVKEPQLETGAVATAYQAVTAGGDYGAGATPLSVSFDGNDGLAAETFVAGTLGADMDCFIPMKRNTSGKIVSLYDNADNGENYVGTMATTSGTVDLGSGAPTYAVNGNVLAAATRPALEAAMGTGRWSLLEIRNANLSGWKGVGIGGYSTFELNGSIGPVRIMPAQTEAGRASIRDALMATYGITSAPIVAPPASGDFYSTRVQNLLPMQKQIRQIYYETYFGYNSSYTVNDIDSRFNEWVLFTMAPKAPAGYQGSKDNYGDGTFTMGNIGEPDLSNDKLLAAHNRGVRLIMSIGGAQNGFNIDTNARRQKVLDSIIAENARLSAGSGVGNIISGLSWNTFEAYLRGVYANNPASCTANTANIVWISQQLAALYGPNFSFHMPPAASMSFSPYDIIVARAMKASGLPFVAASQNYDDDYATKTPGVVGTNNKAWAAEMGQDQSMIGLACGFKGSYARAMTLPFMQTELNTLMASYPNLRGFFLWSQHDKINSDMPAWMNYVIGKIPGKA